MKLKNGSKIWTTMFIIIIMKISKRTLLNIIKLNNFSRKFAIIIKSLAKPNNVLLYLNNIKLLQFIINSNLWLYLFINSFFNVLFTRYPERKNYLLRAQDMRVGKYCSASLYSIYICCSKIVHKIFLLNDPILKAIKQGLMLLMNTKAAMFCKILQFWCLLFCLYNGKKTFHVSFLNLSLRNFNCVVSAALSTLWHWLLT